MGAKEFSASEQGQWFIETALVIGFRGPSEKVHPDLSWVELQSITAKEDRIFDVLDVTQSANGPVRSAIGLAQPPHPNPFPDHRPASFFGGAMAGQREQENGGTTSRFHHLSSSLTPFSLAPSPPDSLRASAKPGIWGRGMG
jgi:hypothetical protein